MRRSKLLNLSILLLFLLIAFSPSLHNNITLVDDPQLLEHLRKSMALDLKAILLPGSSSGLYYRPMMELSYLIDKHIFFLDIKLMHLHNLLLHIGSAVLLFLITKDVLILKNRELPYLPFFVSFIFGLHPIVTEPVNWISGRTDLLAGFFVFSGVRLFLRFLLKQKALWLYLSIICGILGMLAKEVAVVYFGAVFVIYLMAPIEPERKKKELLIFAIALLAMAALYLLIRGTAFQSPDIRIKRTISFLKTSPWYYVYISFRVIGFYVKKFFYPFPLNFTILDVDPLYDLFGIAIVLFIVVLLIKRSFPGAFFIAGIIFLLPSIPIAFRAIAWTPYAERYMYVATGFFSISTVYYLYIMINNPKVRLAVFSLVLIVFTAGTLHRNILWRDYMLLVEDSIRKEPQFLETRLEYGALLMGKGRYAEAREQFEKATRIFVIGYDPRADLALSEIDYHEARYADALRRLDKIIEKLNRTKGSTKDALSLKIKVLQRLVTEKGRGSFYSDLIHTAQSCCEKEKNPYLLYHTGKSMGKTMAGYTCLKRAYELFEEGNAYKVYSFKLLKRSGAKNEI